MASIHQLHPPTAPEAQRTPSESPASRLLRALIDMASTVFSEQLRLMFESADDVLFEMADKAGNSQEQRLYLDTMRVLRLERPRLLKVFNDTMHRSFTRGEGEPEAVKSDLGDMESWSLQGSEEIEEKIAVSNMDAKVESLFSSDVHELENRLASLAERTGGAISAKALSPARLLGAFQESMKGLDVEFPVKLVIYRLFDRIVVGRMGQVFVGANRLLAEHGVQPRATPVGKSAESKAKPVAPESAQRAAAEQANALAEGMDTHQLSEAMAPYLTAAPAHHAPVSAGAAMGAGGGAAAFGPAGAAGAAGAAGFGAASASMPGAAGAPAGAGIANVAPSGDLGRLMEGLAPHTQRATMGRNYTNSDLAADLGSALTSMGQGRPVPNWVPAPNLSAVSRMFDTYYRDPNLPEPAKPLLSRLQFPVMKTAMADPGFFRRADHPVRALVHEVFEMLSGSRNAGPADLARLEQMLEHVLRQLDFDPAMLSRPERRAAAISESDANAFLEDQQRRLNARRQAVIEKIRRIVAQELQLRIGERKLPEHVMPLMLSGIAPALAVQYVRGGPDSDDWQTTLALVDRILQSLDVAVTLPADRRGESEAAIVSETSRCLIAVGIDVERARRLVRGLMEAYLAGPPAAPPASAAAPQEGATAEPPAPVAEPAPPSDSTATRTAAASRPGVGRRALAVILAPGSWFHVWDSTQKETRWLKLHNFNAASDIVVFSDFTGQSLLRMRVATFGMDLANRRSHPVDPDPAVRHSLELLTPEEFAGTETDTPVWFRRDSPSVAQLT